MRLRHVADHRQPAAHIAIQRAVADRQLALVAGGQHQRADLVGERHQRDAAQPRLQILFGHVRRAARRTTARARSRNRSYTPVIGTISNRMPRFSRHLARVGDAVVGGIRPRHADAGDVLRAHRVDRDRRRERRIDAAAQPDQHASKIRTCGCSRACPAPAPGRRPRIRRRNSRAGRRCRRPVSAITRSSSKERAEAITSPVAVHGEAGAVEDQLIVAAHLVHVDHRHRDSAAPRRDRSRAAASRLPM